MQHLITKRSSRDTVTGGMRYMWACSCGKASVWFPTPQRRTTAAEKHVARYAGAVR